MQCYLETIGEISVSVLTWETNPKQNVLNHELHQHFMYRKQANHC